jgi:hypothetical protein
MRNGLGVSDDSGSRSGQRVTIQAPREWTGAGAHSRRNSCQHTIEFASTTRWRNHEPDYHLSTEKWWHPRIKGLDRIAAVRTGVGEAFGVLMHVGALGSPF